MQYRTMPKSEDRLSVLGFGCMRLPVKGGSIDAAEAKRQILYAIENGVNYLDTAWPYHRGASESFLGEHILSDKSIREKVYIATKLPCYSITKAEKFDEIFAKQLSKLSVDYVDYYLLHTLNGSMWQRMVDLGIRDWMDRIKAEGKVRHMGFSFHGKYEDFEKIVDGYDFDFAQVQFNILDENYQAGIKGIKYASKKDLGIIVMEPLRGGALADKIPAEVEDLYQKASIKRKAPDWALRWIYNHPQVTLVLSGMNKIEHIDENIKVASETAPGSLNAQEKAIIEEVRDKYQELMTVGCTGCGYCVPCPVGIDIPGTLKSLNDYHMFSKTSTKAHYMLEHGIMTDDGKPHYTNVCIECGKCEEKCPQNLEIRKALKQAGKDLETPVWKMLAAAARTVLNRTKKKKKK